MEYCLEQRRFRTLQKSTNRKIIPFPYPDKNYNKFFNNYAKKNYKWIDNPCLCKNKNDVLMSNFDRHGVKFLTVICKSCGLMRAKKYLRNKDVVHFYKKIYRTKNYYKHYHTLRPNKLFDKQVKNTRFAFELIKKYKKNLSNLNIVDVGGGIGGVLSHFNKNNQLYLYDFWDPYLKYAKKKKFNVIKGGLDKIDLKPDIVVLSHVVEHWNNFDSEIKKLIKIQKKNITLNYFEFPGIDSLKKGRRQGDILGDIHIPHVYYFQTSVLENLMARHGFKKVYMDSFIRAIFIYTGKKKKLINNYKNTYSDLLAAERFRKSQIYKNRLKIYIPNFILKIFRTLRDNTIRY